MGILQKVGQFLLSVVVLYYMIKLTPLLFTLLLIAYGVDTVKEFIKEKKKIEEIQKKIDVK